MPTGAQLIVELLEEQGVEVAFGLPGVHNLPLWEALRGSSIRLVGVRHEQTAAYAADGYARATGRLGVAIVTTGPGAANTLGAVGEAWASRSPILVIATDIPAALRRPGIYRGVLHETTDQAAMFAPVVKARRSRSPRARRTCRSRPPGRSRAPPPRRAGPRTCRCPTDLLSADGRRRPRTAGSASRLPGVRSRRRSELIDAAERPLIWAGSGAIGGDGVAGAARRADRARRSSPPTAPPACCRPRHPCASACRRTSSRSGGCGTRPTS